LVRQIIFESDSDQGRGLTVAVLLSRKLEGSLKHDFAQTYLSTLCELIKTIDLDVIEQIIDALVQAGERDTFIYFIGNGGSAAMASHYANDIRIGTRVNGHKPLKAISLADNMAILTALANDEGYQNVFVRQLEGILRKEDVVFALSVSGNSPNVLEALRYAKKNGALTIGCTGFDGGVMKNLTDINLHIPTNHGDYGPAEDVFAVVGHLIYSYLKRSRKFHSDICQRTRMP
jgi:D-sedoheptulose 7-phosphate isomerase